MTHQESRVIRRLCLLTSALMLASACATPPAVAPTSAGSSPTSTVPTSTTSTTAVPATSTSTSAVDVTDRPPILVSTAQGVFRIDADGAVTRLIDVRVARAVDDGAGGIVYQSDSGRNLSDAADWSTITYWVPAGETRPRELLVTTRSSGRHLTLHDAWQSDGGLAVLYTRHEGSVPFDDMADTLRIYDTTTKEVTELYSVRGHEWWIDHASAGDGLVVFTEYQLFGRGIVVLDEDGTRIGRVGIPTPSDCFPADDVGATFCPYGATLSADGSIVAFFAPSEVALEVVVQHVDTGAEVARFDAPGDAGDLCDLSAANGWLIVNICDPADPVSHGTALVFELSASAPTAHPLAFAGRATFATTEASGTAGDTDGALPIELRNDGLGVIDFGASMDETFEVLRALIGSAPADPSEEAEWVTFVGWADLGLYVGLSTPRAEGYDGVRRFVGWSYYQPMIERRLFTGRGVTVGTTVAELKELFGDRLVLPGDEPEECGGWHFGVDGGAEPGGWLEGAPFDTTRVTGLHAGMSTGC